jgi:lipopolysaccharide transport system ATP-binding protein
MRDGVLQIGLFGTFDVENYGDLLFPLIAEAELTERLGTVNFHRFSYHAKTPPAWPYTVTSVTELPRMAGNLDGVLVGGGCIVRFDKGVAPGYGPPTPAIHHPTGYWLTPALIALQHGIPLIWNAPGAPGKDFDDRIPAWAEPLMHLALAHSRYIAVRDEPSQAALARFVGKEPITLMPDTAFGLSRLINEQQPSAQFRRLCKDSGLSSPYIVVQTVRGLDSFMCFVKKHSQRLRDFRLLALPIGPTCGDDEAILGDDLPGLVRLHVWPHPLLLAELISQAAGVIGYSYHLAITALAFGVPVFSLADLAFGKYTSLTGFDTIYSLPNTTEIDPDWFMTRLGKATPTLAVRAKRDQLVQHWDRVAAALDHRSTGTQSAVSQFLQSLPSLLESAETRHDASEARSAEMRKLLDLARAEIVTRDDRITRLLSSPSWKVTTPFRFVMRNLKRLVGK